MTFKTYSFATLQTYALFVIVLKAAKLVILVATTKAALTIIFMAERSQKLVTELLVHKNSNTAQCDKMKRLKYCDMSNTERLHLS